MAMLFVCSAPVAAADSDLNLPMLPNSGWVALATGAQHWYAFHAAGSTVDSGAITIRMTVLPEDGATFAVLTTEQVRRWQQGEALSAVGAGTRDELFNHDFSWTGSFIQSGTYCVLVKSSGRSPSNYKLTVSGKDLFFPRPTVEPANGPEVCTNGTAPLPGPQATPTAVPVIVPAQPASSPEQPFPPIGKTMAIAVGERQWYAFRDEGDAASIQVTADATPDNCLTLQVWTPDQLQLWQRGETFRPVGQGTANAFLRADLFWTGSFVKSGLYYVVIARTPTARSDCSYKLWVTGEDVSLVMPSLEQ